VFSLGAGVFFIKKPAVQKALLTAVTSLPLLFLLLPSFLLPFFFFLSPTFSLPVSLRLL